MDATYGTRKLAEGYPGLRQLAHAHFVESKAARGLDRKRVEDLLRLFDRLVPIEPGQRAAVIGCGPMPHVMRVLEERGFTVCGVEPIVSYVESANAYLGRQAVHIGAAESIPLETESQHLMFFESVLEHVDSPQKSLQEIHRVLRPGGFVYLTTTNRQHISLNGDNGEYNVPFFHWLPRLVKESYVFLHLHYRPALANFTQRPAVHWFSFADLCALGREVGFARFYSPLDLRRRTDVPPTRNPLKRWLLQSRLLETVQRSAWLRSLVLTQIGTNIVMLKRRGAGVLSLPRG